jgi:hypothetical protein
MEWLIIALIIGATFAVIMASAHFADRKSNRIRGHAGRVGNTHGDIYFDAGHSAHVHHHDHGSTDFGGGHHG